jgi:hypothetical protein
MAYGSDRALVLLQSPAGDSPFLVGEEIGVLRLEHVGFDGEIEPAGAQSVMKPSDGVPARSR